MAAATKFDIYRMASRLLADARFALITDDVELRYALDDAWDRSVDFVLRAAPWRVFLKTATLAANASAVPGFANGYAYPNDWLRTHAIFLSTTDGREVPIDLREQGINILTNSSVAPVIRYISSDYRDPALANHPWPEQFAQLAAAYLAFLVAERDTGDPGAAARMSQLFASLLPEAKRLEALPEDRWLPYQRNGAMLRGARLLLRQGFWRFAMKTAAISATSGTPAAGYQYAFSRPADWLLTHALYLSSAGREFPFDAREHDTHWSTNVAAFSVRYVATTGLDGTAWSEPFMKALLAYLEAEGGGDTQDGGGAYAVLLKAALASDSLMPNAWLDAQLDGGFLRATHEVLDRGYWDWALKELQLDASQQVASDPEQGFPFRYALPDDHFRTHALFVPWDGRGCPINIRETMQGWSTDAGGSDPQPGAVATFVARYVSTEVFDASGGGDATKRWPEMVMRAVLAFIDWQRAAAAESKVKEAEFNRLLAEALAAHSRPEDEWLRHQLSGRYQQALEMALGRGRWRFAVKTVDLEPSSDPLPAEGSDGSVSSSYGYRFLEPNDLFREIWVYYLIGTGPFACREDVDYRAEGGAYHANYTPLTLRYVSRFGFNSTKWPANFRRAVHACALHLENPADAKLLALYEQAEDKAEGLDDARDMPPVRRTGRFVSARYGRSTWDRENAWPPPWA